MISPSPSSFRNAATSEDLVAQLRADIESGRLRDGERIMALRDLADRYGISFNGARTAINRLQEMQLVEMRQGSGTFVRYKIPQAASDERAAHTVAMLVDSRGHVYARFSSDLTAALQQQDFTPLSIPPQPAVGDRYLLRQIEVWKQSPPRAVVVQWLADGFNLTQVLQEALGNRSRIISAFHQWDSQWHSVAPDYQNAAALAVEHLLERGHRRIGLVTYARSVYAHLPYTKRKRTASHTDFILGAGYALRNAGLRNALTIHYNRVSPMYEGDALDEENIRSMMEWLQQEKRPTAFIGDDFRLIALSRAAARLGLRAPDDFEMIGFGNTPWSQALGISSVSFNEELVARKVAELIAMSEHQDEVRHHILVPPRLVIRS